MSQRMEGRPSLGLGIRSGGRWRLLLAAVSLGADRAPYPARAGLDLAASGAGVVAGRVAGLRRERRDVADDGSAQRWGYLFYSPSLQKSRVYSVRDGKIVVAENLEMKLEAPPVASGWIDSGAALAAAEQDGGGSSARSTTARSRPCCCRAARSATTTPTRPPGP